MHRGLGRHHASQPCQPSALSTLGPGPLHHRRSTAPPHTPDKVTNIPCLLSPSTPVSRPSHPPARRPAVWLAQRTKLGLCSQPRVIFACCLATAGPRQHRTSASPEQSCAAASVRDPPSPIHSTLPGNTTTSSTSPEHPPATGNSIPHNSHDEGASYSPESCARASTRTASGRPGDDFEGFAHPRTTINDI